jgi:tetratricopeptide (TPR) repeat protein
MNSACSSPEDYFFAGNRCLTSGDARGAEECFRHALAMNPDFPEVLANLGLVKEQAGELIEAECFYRRSIALAPNGVQVILNLAAMLFDAKRFVEAETLYGQALRAEPDSPAAWSNYGVLLACLKREDEAENCYRTALSLDSAYLKAHFNLAYILLRQGRLAEGWSCLEAREWYTRLESILHFPRWRGEPLSGKSILIGCEVGHGDMIQFCRYARLLKELGAVRIGLLCHPSLVCLFRSLSAVDEVLSLEEKLPETGWDFWTPPLSLPLYCQTRLETIPAAIPYLAADPERMARWLPLLPSAGLRVGLVWKGNPKFENDADRSLPSLDTLSPLAAVAGVAFVSLQKGQGEDEARHPPDGFSVLPLGEGFDDFADTAAVISGLDLVISVDTAVAHLAGAMGKPCWVLLPEYRADWRWLVDRDDSPWYPEVVRLFRQPSGGGWEPVVASVVEALRQWKHEAE